MLSDPNPSIFEEAIQVHVVGDDLPVPRPVFRTVDRSPGLYQGFRGRVSVGSLAQDLTSSVSGRLVGSCLLGTGSQAGGPVPALLCHTLGIVINEKKSGLVTSQTAKYLSMTIDTEAGNVFSSLARVKKFLTVVESFCTMTSPPAQLWQVVFGHLASLERLAPYGRLRMRSLQWHLKAHWSPETDLPSLPVPLPQEARRDLSWWMVKDHLLTGVRFGTPAPVLHLDSDASCLGWGAHLLDQHVSGVWSDQEKLLHINLLEMKALFLALQAFREDVIGHRVKAMCDNSTVVAYVNKQGGTVSYALCSLASHLLRWTESLDIHLDVRYLPGQSNVMADLLSRRGQVVGKEWSLHPQVARSLLRVWGNPSIDLFATSCNAKLPLYCSLVPDPQAVFEDAFCHPWDDLDVYAFSPFPRVSRVVARVRESSCLAMTLLWLVSWKGRCSSQRHCTSSRGFSNSLTSRQGFVRFCV